MINCLVPVSQRAGYGAADAEVRKIHLISNPSERRTGEEGERDEEAVAGCKVQLIIVRDAQVQQLYII